MDTKSLVLSSKWGFVGQTQVLLYSSVAMLYFKIDGRWLRTNELGWSKGQLRRYLFLAQTKLVSMINVEYTL